MVIIVIQKIILLRDKSFFLTLILSLPNLAKSKFRPFSTIYMKVQEESFHLNGHVIGFRPQTQKSELPYKTPLFILAVKVKGLRDQWLK